MAIYMGVFSVPSGAPENVSAEAMSSTSILVTWGSVPEHQKNGHILGYKVQLLYQRECFKTLKIPHRFDWRVLHAKTLQRSVICIWRRLTGIIILAVRMKIF